MKKYYRILPLLPILSNAMMHSCNDELKCKAAEQISFDIIAEVGDFVGVSKTLTFYQLMFTDSKNFRCIYDNFQHKSDQAQIYSPQACENATILSRILKILRSRGMLPSHISIPIQLSTSVRNKFELFFEENRLLKKDVNYVTADVVLGKIIMFQKKSERLLSSGFLQTILKNVKFRTDSQEKEMVDYIEKIASGFEYISNKAFTEGSKENVDFKKQLKQKIEDKIYFIIPRLFLLDLERCVPYLNQMHVITIIDKKMARPCISFNPVSLGIYATTSNFFLNFSGFSNVYFLNSDITQAETNFFSGCIELTNLNLSQLENLELIENDFLNSCTGLTNLDLSFQAKIACIGDSFLGGCLSLRSIKWNPLSQITKLGSFFLSRCAQLKEIDLRPLRQITKIGGFFLNECSGITQLDLSPLKNVKEIELGFLMRCNGLTSLDLSPFSQVTNIGAFFMNECSALPNLDLSSLHQITDFYVSFLQNCRSLMTIDLSPFKRVTIIRNNFLNGCSQLTCLNLSEFTDVTEVDKGFLNECAALKIEGIDLGTIRENKEHPLIKAVFEWSESGEKKLEE